MIAFFLLAGYLPHAAIFYEQFSTKWLYFEKISSLETVLILITCILIAAIEPVYCLAMTSPVSGFTLVELLFIISSSGSFITFVKTVKRARATHRYFWLFCALLIAVAGMVTVCFTSPEVIFYIITAYSGLYIGNLQRGHLADGKTRLPDLITPVILVAALIFEPLRQKSFLYILNIYLACHTLWIAAHTFWILRKYWFWKNPAQSPI
jgi:hypothetical protein